MADISSFVMDPFYALSREVEATKTKVADSVFENYKLQVSQSTFNPMAYDLLKQAKTKFIETLMELSEKYRCVDVLPA